MATLIQLRRGTAAEWAADDEILAEGQAGWDETNNIIKVGDGVTPWSELEMVWMPVSGGEFSGPVTFGDDVTLTQPLTLTEALTVPAPTLPAHAARVVDIIVPNYTYPPIVLDAGALIANTGSPSKATIGANWYEAWPAWLVDAAVRESVVGTYIPPANWATVDYVLWWTNAGAGAGNVTWNLRRLGLPDGGNMVANTAEVTVTTAAPLLSIIKRTVLEAAAPVTSGRLTRIQVDRNATVAGDTLANDAALIAIEIRRAS